MHITDPRIQDYTEMYTSEPSDILKRVERETYMRSIYPRMLSGKLQGRFLSMISRMIKPGNVLEIGTFTGYSTLCLLEGLREDGQIHTIDINEELGRHNEFLFKEAGASDRIITHYGNALDIIPHLGIVFDLIFIDADKANYCKYFELGMENLQKGGFILADNVLWSGKVLKIGDASDKDTLAVQEFNEMVQNDSRVENVMIPLRDGITLMQKIC